VITTADSAKARAARAGASLVESGMSVGLGSGSTAALMLRFLASRIEEHGLRITGVPTSEATARLARTLGIPVCELDDVSLLDINLDGADEIDSQFRMIKGRGGALLREKIVASASARRVTMITNDKRVERLGISSPVPVEVSVFGLRHSERRLQRLGAATLIRRGGDGALVVTDGGNAIIDCRFANIADASSLDCELQGVPGLLETGIFVNLCDTLIVGTSDGVETIETSLRTRA
jgi:ribose 5-phosphate isomerase A